MALDTPWCNCVVTQYVLSPALGSPAMTSTTGNPYGRTQLTVSLKRFQFFFLHVQNVTRIMPYVFGSWFTENLHHVLQYTCSPIPYNSRNLQNILPILVMLLLVFFFFPPLAHGHPSHTHKHTHPHTHTKCTNPATKSAG